MMYARNQRSRGGTVFHTCIDSTLKKLARLQTDRRMFSSMRIQIQKVQVELKFLKMFIWCLAKWNGTNKNMSLGSSLKNSIEAAIRKAEKGLNAAAVKALQGGYFKDWDFQASRLLEKVKQFKPTIEATCLDLLDCSPQCKSSTSYEVIEFVESTLKNLNDLVSSKVDMVVDMKQQIGILQEKLKLFRNVYVFARKQRINPEKFKDLDIQIRSWTHNTACLSLLYWVDNKEEEKVVLKMNHVLSDMIQNAKPGPLEIGMYFGALKASKSLRSNIFLGAEVTNNDTEILHEGLMFLVSLLLDPPQGDHTEVYAIVKEAAFLISSYCFGKVKENIAKENSVLISDFLEKFEMIKAKVRKIRVQEPDSSLVDFPKTNSLGFMDLLLINLEEKLKYIPILKRQILAVQKGFTFMMPILEDILQLQNECSEIKDLLKRIINLAYRAEHVIDSSVGDSPIWCVMICLSNVKEEIENIISKVKKMKEKGMFNIESAISAEMNSSQILTNEGNSTSQTQVFVGFKDEEERIIDKLRRGSMERSIVSIVGMPGLGKTTLAKKIYDSSLVQSQFHKLAWCSVSQFYKRRELLSAILKAICTFVGENQGMSEEDMEHLIYKSLKGQRYLIVLDDIWEIGVWEELQQSFPNDRNGSRIMLTSRILHVALQADPNSHPHLLRSFSHEECWELLRKKLFHTDDCPPNFLYVGMQIAKKCKGLPLAVVVIAGLLAKEVTNLGWWRKIEESLGSHIASTSCMDIIELSYNHLPDFLKACFLYLGAFQHQKINAKKLTLLWIGEGFILNPVSKSLKEVAQECLMDLISRNLVLVSRKSSICGIEERYYMHDLILELCLKKAKEENFMELVQEDDIRAKPVGSPTNPTRYDKYRLIFHGPPSSLIASSATGQFVRSIIFPLSYALGRINLINFCNNFKFLKVLHLWSLVGGWMDEPFPTELTSLVHLRYLAVMFSYIESIPPSIANLKNLETFLVWIEYDCVTKLPNAIWKMRRLRHVKIGRASISSGDDVFEEFYQLDDIESFSSIVLEHKGDEKLLRRIPRVQKLKLTIFGSWNNQFSVFGTLSNLEALSLAYEGTYDHYIPPYLSFWVTKPYPYAISFPLNLKKLSLNGLRRPWKEISVIGKLPNLEVLKLKHDAFVGEIWDLEDEEFLNLRCLKLYFLRFRQWNASSDPFPCLQQLYVANCSKLEGIPSSFGAISTLKVIQVSECSEYATISARQIVEEQQDFGNEDLEVHIRERSWH